MNVVEVVNFWKDSSIVLLNKTEAVNLPKPGKSDGRPVDF